MMIEINLLPGASRRSRRGGSALSLFADRVGERVKDMYLIGAVAAVLLAGAAIAGMYLQQSHQADALEAREDVAARDSARFAAVLVARHRAETARDSVYQQLAIVKSIDDSRFIWPHVLEEISLALPQYTWLTGVEQTTPVTTTAGLAGDTSAAAAQARADSAKQQRSPQSPAVTAKAKQARADSLYKGQVASVGIRILGQTVDIQALTQFMKNLEASPFLKNVQLTRSDLVMVNNQQVTSFQLQAETETPPSSALHTVPLSIAVH